MNPATSKEIPGAALGREVIEAFDKVNGGVHPGFRPAHAKGILLAGAFTPAANVASLSNAPHLERPSTPISVRFSDFAGVPAVPDNDPNASPRGLAIRFHLAEHSHTDILAHSADGFPARTAEEFVEFLHAAAASGPGVAHPLPIEVFLGSHPAALEFVQMPKPFPSSFAKESYFGVSAYKFTTAAGVSVFGRYRIRPEGGAEHLTAEAVAAKSATYLIDEIQERVKAAPARLKIFVQVAEPGDVVDDSTIHWGESRREVEFGTVEISSVVPSNEAEQRQIIFDPIPRVTGIEPSGDPLLEPRASVYLMSGRRRRAGASQ